MTIEKEVNRYVHSLSYKRASVRQKVKRRLINFFASSRLLRTEIEKFKKAPDRILSKMIDGVQSYTRNKKQLVTSLRNFLQFLHDKYDIEIDLDVYFPLGKYMDTYERRLEMLKFLHDDPKTQEEIAAHFGVSRETVHNDLQLLQSGEYYFLDYEMKIELDQRQNTYDSTIHPIFLPLNLSEVHALTVGLKMLSKQHHIFGDMYDYIAEQIYSQLSPYGKKMIDQSARQERVQFKDVDERAYRYEYDLLDELLKEKRTGMYSYFIKSEEDCEIIYRERKSRKKVIGKMKTARSVKGKDVYDYISITKDDGAIVTIPIKQIVQIKRLKKRS